MWRKTVLAERFSALECGGPPSALPTIMACCARCPGSAAVPAARRGVSPRRTLESGRPANTPRLGTRRGKFASARRRCQHSGRVRYPEHPSPRSHWIRTHPLVAVRRLVGNAEGPPPLSHRGRALVSPTELPVSPRKHKRLSKCNGCPLACPAFESGGGPPHSKTLSRREKH